MWPWKLQEDIQIKVLRHLAERELSTAELKALYDNPGRGKDGTRVGYMVRNGWAEWVRPDGHLGYSRPAIGIRITDAGRAHLDLYLNKIAS